MKRNHFFTVIVTLLLVTATSCNDMLNEEPQSILVPAFFNSAQGLEAGLNASYSGLRFQYGTTASLETAVIGTDEFYSSDAMNGNEGAMDTYTSALNPGNGQIYNAWVRAFAYINNCNGIIQMGANTSMDESRKKTLLAEAKFLRGLYYFILVQNYGAVPLDLGAGKLAYNTNPSTLSERNSITEVYDVIINDFKEALADLPVKPAQTGRVAQGAALHFLAKAYLTRATSEAKKADDYANAFKSADELIKNQATYGAKLQEDFGLVHLEGHENDPEVIFNVQFTHDVVFGEGNGSNPPDGGGKQQLGGFFFTAGYENVRINGITPVPRSIRYQRPWRMFVPTPWLIHTAFAEKKTDSRWDNSFRMVWECGVSTLESVGIKSGDPAIVIYFEGDDISAYPAAVAKYKVENLYDNNGIFKNSSVEYMYPNLVKYDDTKRAANNDYVMRPFLVARLAETYLIAAEALVMQGNKTDALSYINTVRKRAAYRPRLSASELAAAQSAIEIKDANTLSLDFILDERARELCGEQHRWFDLTRTGKLVERVKAFNPKGAPNVQDYHVLRPIPQSQIDLMSDPEQKAKYQNPGYK